MTKQRRPQGKSDVCGKWNVGTEHSFIFFGIKPLSINKNWWYWSDHKEHKVFSRRSICTYKYVFDFIGFLVGKTFHVNNLD